MILQTAATGGLRGAHVLTAGESVVLLGAPVTSARLPVPHVVHVTSAEGATARAPEPLAPLADESGAGVLFVGSWVEPLSVEHDPVALIAPLRALLCAASGTTKHAQPRDLSPSFAGWVLGMVYPEGQGEPPEPILLPFGRTTKAVAALDELEARAPAVFTPGSADPALARECVASGLADGDDAHSAIIQAALYSGRAALLCEYIASRDGDVYDDQRWHRPLAELVEAEFRRTRAAITAFASDYVWTQTGESRATCDIIAGAQPIVEGVALVLGALSDRATDDRARRALARDRGGARVLAHSASNRGFVGRCCAARAFRPHPSRRRARWLGCVATATRRARGQCVPSREWRRALHATRRGRTDGR